MPFGPGKYDAECTELRERLKAEGIILIVVRGMRGGGFSAQLNLADTMSMPQTLRFIADQIETSGGQA
jgi:hypothetical protein